MNIYFKWEIKNETNKTVDIFIFDLPHNEGTSCASQKTNFNHNLFSYLTRGTLFNFKKIISRCLWYNSLPKNNSIWKLWQCWPMNRNNVAIKLYPRPSTHPPKPPANIYTKYTHARWVKGCLGMRHRGPHAPSAVDGHLLLLLRDRSNITSSPSITNTQRKPNKC